MSTVSESSLCIEFSSKDRRMNDVGNMTKEDFFSKASLLLKESVADKDVSWLEHKELHELLSDKCSDLFSLHGPGSDDPDQWIKMQDSSEYRDIIIQWLKMETNPQHAKEDLESIELIQERKSQFDFLDSNDPDILEKITGLKYSKEDDVKAQTIREELQGQIDFHGMHDASGKLIPETLWGLICFKAPDFKYTYSLDDTYDTDDISLVSVVVAVSAAMAEHSQKTAHLRR